MPTTTSQQFQQSFAGFLLTGAGPLGTAIFVVGGILFLWGLINLAGRRNKATVLAHLTACAIPIGLTVLICNQAYSVMAVIAASSVTPPPALLRDSAGALTSGVTGPIFTILPASLALIQLWRLRLGDDQ
jgi:hypothetical protein